MLDKVRDLAFSFLTMTVSAPFPTNLTARSVKRVKFFDRFFAILLTPIRPALLQDFLLSIYGHIKYIYTTKTIITVTLILLGDRRVSW